MRKERVFLNCKIAKTKGGITALVDGPQELVDLMDGDFFEDNCMSESEKLLPHAPGFYIADVEFWFEQGFFEGYPSPGESDIDFRVSNIRQAPNHNVNQTGNSGSF